MKKTLVILVHGFNVTDGGAGTIGKLKRYYAARGAKVVSVRYGWFGLFQTRFCNEEVSENLTYLIQKGSQRFNRIIVVGHSNGCAIAHLASYKGTVPIHRFVYINPALKKHYTPDGRVKAVDVWHNWHDSAVVWAKFLFWRASERPWGLMGRTGYRGDDQRFVNFDTAEDFTHSAKGHSGVFATKSISFFGPLIAGISMSETMRSEKRVD